MTSRKQYVNIQDTSSDNKEILCGVPQGSILGPKLVIIYINEICNISTTLKFTLFADDTNIFYSGYNINNMCKSISREVSIVNEWLCVNKLSIKKFLYCKSVTNPVAKIKDNITERVKVTKLLGIYINENLSWKDHISYISNKLSKSITILYHVSCIINTDALRNLYCTLILPYLS